MVVDHTGKVTLRVGRMEFTRLGWALLISAVAHLLFWGSCVLVVHFDLARKVPLPKWVQNLAEPPAVEAKTPAPPREPYIFIDVRENQAVAEAPKNAIRYSDLSSVAANPEVNLELNEPKLEGEKNELQNTEDTVPKNKYDQLMPDPPKPEPERPQEPGAMTIAKAELRPVQERQRPRTIREALMQRSNTPGKRSQFDGGARQQHNASLAVQATGFGAYDRMLIDSVRYRWYDLLGNLSADGYRQGKVVIQFTLNYKGDVTDVNVGQNSVSEMLALMCEKAIRDPAPFGEWSREMRLAVGSDSRRITFTFFYN